MKRKSRASSLPQKKKEKKESVNPNFFNYSQYLTKTTFLFVFLKNLFINWKSVVNGQYFMDD